MSETLDRVRELIARELVRISDHAYQEFVDRDIFAEDVVLGVGSAIVVETIRMPPMDLQFWCCNMTTKESRFTFCGVYRRGILGRPSS